VLAHGKGARGFAEFEGFCTGRFRPGTQLLKSAMFTNFITRAGRTRFYHRLGVRHRGEGASSSMFGVFPTVAGGFSGVTDRPKTRRRAIEAMPASHSAR
jgi:hypothetical protein